MTPTQPGRNLLDRLTLRWTPVALHSDPEAMRRAKLVVGLSWVLVAGNPVSAVVSWLVEQQALVPALLLLNNVLFILAPVVLKRTGSVAAAARLLCAGLTLGVGAVSAVHGGLTNPGLPWLMLPPFLATLASGERAGRTWVAASTMTILLVGALGGLGLLSAEEPSRQVRQQGSMSSALLLLFIGYAMAALFETLRSTAMAELHATQRALVHSREQQMLTERMASLGTLAAGVAHEINNPIMFISSNLEFVIRILQQPASLDPEALHECQTALTESAIGVRRVRDIVRDLKMFSRPEQPEASRVDCTEVMRTSARLASNALRHRTQLHLDLRPVPQVMVHEGQLAQVLVNLLTNAVQALPERDPLLNTITVSTGVQGDQVVLEVTDNGSGMPANVLARIFDPFFTTKPVGLGTGLGLSICHRLVSGMGGRMEVRSQEGAGSTFRVLLPAGPLA